MIVESSGLGDSMPFPAGMNNRILTENDRKTGIRAANAMSMRTAVWAPFCARWSKRRSENEGEA